MSNSPKQKPVKRVQNPKDAMLKNEAKQESVKREFMKALIQISMAVLTLLTSFSIFLLLKIEDIIDWNWWYIFSPLGLIALLLLLCLVRKEVVENTIFAVRMVFVMWIVACSVFGFLLVTALERTFVDAQDPLVTFIPLWAISGIFLLFSAYLFYRGCCHGGDKASSDNYANMAIPFFCFSLIFAPLVVLLGLKEVGIIQSSWGISMIPLFAVDLFFFLF